MQFSKLSLGLLLLACSTSAQQIQDRPDRPDQYGEDRCSVYPDPHFHTFDSVYYDFHYPCEFDLVLTQDFQIQIRTQRNPGAAWSFVSGVAFRSMTDTLSFETSSPGPIYNGVPVASPPFSLPHPTGPILITPDGTGNGFWFNFQTGDSIHVWMWSGSGHVEVNGVGPSSAFWRGKGLCGFYNGNPLDDFTHRGGAVVTPIGSPQPNIDQWAWTWKVLTSLFGPPPSDWQCDRTPIIFTGEFGDDWRREAEAACQKTLPDTDLFDNCVFDVLMTRDRKWADSIVYNKPMRCLQGCECDKHHPRARCLDRCLLDHDCIPGKCPNRGCVCNVPRDTPTDPLCNTRARPDVEIDFELQLADVTGIASSTALTADLYNMCKDNGCREKGGVCRVRGDRRCHCSRDGVVCPQDAKICPDGTVLHRDPANNCRFPPCPGGCTDDVFTCPDGTTLSRDPDNNCQFPPCRPGGCPDDVRICPDGTTLARDPLNKCQFPDCPGEVCPDGTRPVLCTVNPCDVNECPAVPNAICKPNYCGGCNAEFYDADGNLLTDADCQGTTLGAIIRDVVAVNRPRPPRPSRSNRLGNRG